MKNSNSQDDTFDPFAPINYPPLSPTNLDKSAINTNYVEDNNDFPSWIEPDNGNPDSPYCWYNNERHCYLKVPLSHLELVGAIELISGASYVENDHVYLEEDGDAYHFIDALKASGKEFHPKKILVNDLSFLKGLSHFGSEDETYYSYNDINHPDLVGFTDNKEDVLVTPNKKETPDLSFLEKPDWED